MKNIFKLSMFALLITAPQLLRASSLTKASRSLSLLANKSLNAAAIRSCSNGSNIFDGVEFLQNFNQNPKDPKTVIFRYPHEGSRFIGMQELGKEFQSKELKPTGCTTCRESVGGNHDNTTIIDCAKIDAALRARGFDPFGNKLKK